MDAEELLKPRHSTASGHPEEDVRLPGIGGLVVRVRGLSRAEVITMRKATDQGNLDGPRALVLERKMIALALLDPEMSEAQVGKWQTLANAGELEPITAAIQELSGMGEGAPKSDVAEDGDGS